MLSHTTLSLEDVRRRPSSILQARREKRFQRRKKIGQNMLNQRVYTMEYFRTFELSDPVGVPDAGDAGDGPDDQGPGDGPGDDDMHGGGDDHPDGHAGGGGATRMLLKGHFETALSTNI
eukprot:6759150-Pyramimonas_sp.AAC.1